MKMLPRSRFTSPLGEYTVRVETPPSESALLHWTVTLTPATPTLLPFWPSDVYPLDAQGDPKPRAARCMPARRGWPAACCT